MNLSNVQKGQIFYESFSGIVIKYLAVESAHMEVLNENERYWLVKAKNLQTNKETTLSVHADYPHYFQVHVSMWKLPQVVLEWKHAQEFTG